MVTIIDILMAINKQLKTVYPSVIIQSTDVKEGFNRPCFYVDIVDFDNELVMETFDRKRAAFSLYYFPTDPNNYRMELLEVRETLQNAFIGILNIGDGFNIHILDTETRINDGVLNFDFEIEYYQRRNEIELPYIQDMEI